MSNDTPNLAGLAPRTCPTACTAERCVISGINVCSHPFGTGLQSALLGNPDVVRRFQMAKDKLAGKVLDVTTEAGSAELKEFEEFKRWKASGNAAPQAKPRRKARTKRQAAKPATAPATPPAAA